MADKFVSINMLGICEDCGAFLNMAEKPGEAIVTCPQCKKSLSGVSFGFSEGGIRVRWVGPEISWVTLRPTQDFQVGDLTVMVEEIELQKPRV